jgi:DNA-binding beta-propeller fold protein YncE
LGGLSLVVLVVAFALSLGLALPTPASAAYDVVAEWGSQGSGDGQFSRPAGIAADADGNVYVADGGENQRIQKFSSDGTFITKWGSRGSGDGQFKLIAGIATDTDGDVYVADGFENTRIQKFASDGTFLTKWGSSDGQFGSIAGIATDSDGYVYVAEVWGFDTAASRVEKFEPDGTFITKWWIRGGGQFVASGIAAAPGAVYVADGFDPVVEKFTSDGTFLGRWGSSGTGEGQFRSLDGIATDAGGNLYVAEGFYDGRFQKFAPNGALLAKWGEGFDYCPGSGGYSPESISTDPAGNVYVATWHSAKKPSRIQVFATVPFDTKITSGPCRYPPPDSPPVGTRTGDNTPTFRFSGRLEGLSFECRLDSQSFAPCSSPFTAARLDDGLHTFYVRGRRGAPASYVDPTPDSAEFSIDTRVRGVNVTAKPSQPQKGRLIKVEVEAGAKERVTAKATGKVKVKVKGKRARAFKLSRQLKRVDRREVKVFRLKPSKRKHHRKIFKALDKGKKVRAPIRVKLTDQAGNSVREKRVVRLTRRG